MFRLNKVVQTITYINNIQIQNINKYIANYRNKFKQQFTTKKKKSTLNLLVTSVHGFDLLHTEFAAVARLAEGQFFNDKLTKLKFLI